MAKSRTKFLVLATPRSGTNWLITLLNQHPEICCFFEILNTYPDARTDAYGEEYRDEDDGAGFIDRVYSREYRRLTRCVGFKLFYNDAQVGNALSAWEYLRADTAIKVVHVVRENQLELYVSFKKAMADRRWLVSADAPRPPDPGPITIDSDDFEKYVADVADGQKRALSFFESHEVCTLVYEEMARSRNRSLKRLMKFLGLRAYPWLWKVKEPTVKQETVSMRQRISNYDELAKNYEGTPLASHFDLSRD